MNYWLRTAKLVFRPILAIYDCDLSYNLLRPKITSQLLRSKIFRLNIVSTKWWNHFFRPKLQVNFYVKYWSRLTKKKLRSILDLNIVLNKWRNHLFQSKLPFYGLDYKVLNYLQLLFSFTMRHSFVESVFKPVCWVTRCVALVLGSYYCFC